MIKPLVSIIVNCYNGEKYLQDAINSIYAQSYQNWEIIFWDNDSNDNSAEIALSYDKKLRYYKSQSTTPLGKARTQAVSKAKGEYLAFLDCDDLWHTKKIEKQIGEILNRNDVGLVYCKTNIISENGEIISKHSNHKSLIQGDVFEELVKHNFIPFVSVLIPQKIYYECGGFPDSFENSTDYYLFLSIAYRYKVLAIQEPCCDYRIHSDNLSHKQQVLCALEDIRAVSKFLPDLRAKNALSYQYVNLAVMYLKERSFVKFIKTMVQNGGLLILMSRLTKSLSNENKK